MFMSHGPLEREREVAIHPTDGFEAVAEAKRLTGEVRVVERRPRMDGYVWGVLRLFMAWIFMWPFLDKVFGWGYATQAGNGWIDGGSPTSGYLEFATEGPFAGLFQDLAGSAVVDWLFMLGLLGVGVALMLGIGVRIGALTGAAMLTLMWLATMLPEFNPWLDDHIVYAFILIGLVATGAGRYIGLGGWWMRTRLVRRFRFLT